MSSDEPINPDRDSERILRRRAEEQARRKSKQLPANLEALSSQDARQLLHELQVHQIELEMQNDELRRIQSELEASRARYLDLYELAPAGYFTLDENGLIREANLSAARMLGVERQSLVKKPLSRFILPEDQDIYYRHRKELLETGASQVFELRMLRTAAAPLWVRVETVAGGDADGARLYRLVMGDITELKEKDRRRDSRAEILDILNVGDSLTHMINGVLPAIKREVGVEMVGIRLRIANDFPYFAQVGLPADFLLTENSLVVRDPSGALCRGKDGGVSLECTCGLVISGHTDPTNPSFTPR
jgi:PAS domain S-box-containing protein